MKVFESAEFGSIRTVTIDEEVWFVGKEVAEALGYERTTKAVVDRVDEDDRHMLSKETQSQFGIELGQRGGWIINESGLYSLILSSKLDSAKRFKHWVTKEVLPSLRKHGGYVVGQESMSKMEFFQMALQYANDMMAEKDEQIKFLAPKASYTDEVLKADNAVNITAIAKDYGMSGVKLNKILEELHIQYKVGSQYVLYSKYQSEGYTTSETYTYTRTDETTGANIRTKWTQKGRRFIHDKLASIGIYPVGKEGEGEW